MQLREEAELRRDGASELIILEISKRSTLSEGRPTAMENEIKRRRLSAIIIVLEDDRF